MPQATLIDNALISPEIWALLKECCLFYAYMQVVMLIFSFLKKKHASNISVRFEEDVFVSTSPKGAAVNIKKFQKISFG